MSRPTPTLVLRNDDGVVVSEWTTSPSERHFHDSTFDDYDGEVITLKAVYEHRADIKALDWEETHRKWPGVACQLDFAAHDTAVHHSLGLVFERAPAP